MKSGTQLERTFFSFRNASEGRKRLINVKKIGSECVTPISVTGRAKIYRDLLILLPFAGE
jgi:hypothetical protein